LRITWNLPLTLLVGLCLVLGSCNSLNQISSLQGKPSPAALSYSSSEGTTVVATREFADIRKLLLAQNTSGLELEVPNVIIVSPYALASWALYPPGLQGEALLLKQAKNQKWEVLSQDQGAIDITALETLRVPALQRNELHERKLEAYEIQAKEQEIKPDSTAPTPIDYLSGKFYSNDRELSTR
jgi:hypothetical protein